MRITLDNVVVEMQPTGVSWGDAQEIGRDGNGAPVYAPYRDCSLAFERLTVVEYWQWFGASEDGDSHNVRLPHPSTGTLTEYACYVSKFSPRINTRDVACAAASGVDITLARIYVV